MDDYRKQRIRAITGKSPPPSKDGKEGKEKQDAIFMDADVKHEDRMTQDRIRAILHDHNQEMANYIPPEKKKVNTSKRITNHQESAAWTPISI